MTAIPSFHIEGLSTDGENTPGTIITGLTSTDYDSLIKTHPEARLKYLDEDEDEVIVGSSAELIDRINDLPSNLPLKFQTATSLGLDGWLAFLLDRSTPAADRPSSPEDLERTLFEGFQRDLEAAIKASLVPDAVPSSSTTPPQRPKPQTVDSFLNAIASTVQSTLSSVYPHTAQITTSLRQNPALRQAAEVLQTVGRTAQQTVQHPEERAKVATEIATEIKSAVQVVGGVLGDMMQEVGSGYAQVGREISKDVQKLEVKKTVNSVGTAVGNAGSVVGGVVKEVGQAYAIVGREIGKGVKGFVKTAVMAAGTAPVGAGSVRWNTDVNAGKKEEAEKEEAKKDETTGDESSTQEKQTAVAQEQPASELPVEEKPASDSASAAKPVESKPEVDAESEEAFNNTVKTTFDKLWSASDADLDAMLAAADGEVSQEITESADAEQRPEPKTEALPSSPEAEVKSSDEPAKAETPASLGVAAQSPEEPVKPEASASASASQTTATWGGRDISA